MKERIQLREKTSNTKPRLIRPRQLLPASRHTQNFVMSSLYFISSSFLFVSLTTVDSLDVSVGYKLTILGYLGFF